MLIAGEWQLFDDGVTRPTVRAKVLGGDGSPIVDDFLIDTGADRTVFRAALLARLRLPATNAPPDSTLSGIGGTSAFVLVTTVIEFVRDDGGPVRVRGEFAGFTDPAATDLSVLGRDVLDNFDLIISRRRSEILLLAPRHHYRLERD
ncbi:MAG TPA: aspartyl protease family protein [Candidatus Binatia bacterium]|nr:aspartyl protease family protein [Candidatus Binatia bacterium]